VTGWLLDRLAYWLDELFPLPLIAVIVGCGLWATWGIG
jgi:hypothetical protein